MKKPVTYHAIVLDKSGSMAPTKAATISGFNEKIQQLKEDAKSQEIYCSLVTFNGEIYEHLWNVSADKLSEANPEDYIPNGGTAFLDAHGYVVQKLLNTTDYMDINNAYIVEMISDGQSNSDKHYNFEAWNELIQGCQNTKRWTFPFVGCTKEYLERIAKKTGIPVSNMGIWLNDTAQATKSGFANMKSRQKKFYAERLLGQTSSNSYASDNSCVANYKVVVAETAASPMIVSVGDLTASANVGINELLARSPKYVEQQLSWNGGSLLANNLKVQWTPESKS